MLLTYPSVLADKPGSLAADRRSSPYAQSSTAACAEETALGRALFLMLVSRLFAEPRA